MNGDLISRSALLRRVPVNRNDTGKTTWDWCILYMADIIKTIPAVDAPKWISVEDKFPEDVLADKDTKVIHCLVALEPPRSQPNRKPLVTKAQRQWNSWIKRWEWGRVSGVIYWMPLPEPPKEG